jgi:hypothetical protein
MGCVQQKYTWMPFKRFLPVGTLDFILISRVRNAQHRIVTLHSKGAVLFMKKPLETGLSPK